MIALVKWAPAALLSAGAFLVHGLGPQQALELRQSLAETVPHSFDVYEGVDLEVSAAEARVAGFSDYLFRVYAAPESDVYAASLYVGYYESQMQGRTIHSPKNCLPGAGWEPLASEVALVPLAGGASVEVNRYILQREGEQALVLYWYQGRGRIAHNEYMVKWDLLRDAALRQRSDEALVRIVVPVTTTVEDAFERARDVASTVIPELDHALPL
jgi:EpsI family protein